MTQGLEVEEYNLAYNLGSGSEKQKLDYLATISGTLDGSISLHLQSAPNNYDASRLALTTIFRRKGRILDLLTDELQILRQQIDDPESKTLLAELIDIRTQIANLTFKKSEDIPVPEKYQEQLAKLQQKANNLADRISRRSSEFRTLSQPVILETIQEIIPNNSALVELVKYRPFNPKAPSEQRWGQARYAAYVLHSQGEPQAIDLGEAETIEQAAAEFRSHLRNQQSNIDKQLKPSGRKLDELLMKPVRKLLGNKNNILLSPITFWFSVCRS